MAEWISVKDRLPEGIDYNKVLLYNGKDKSFTIFPFCLFKYLTNKDGLYWMPLPEPPREVQNDG